MMPRKIEPKPLSEDDRGKLLQAYFETLWRMGRMIEKYLDRDTNYPTAFGVLCFVAAFNIADGLCRKHGVEPEMIPDEKITRLIIAARRLESAIAAARKTNNPEAAKAAGKAFFDYVRSHW